MFLHGSDDGYLDALPGIRRKTLSHGAATLMTEFRLRAGCPLPIHDHPQEQTGYLVSGRLRLTIGEETHDVAPGDSWSSRAACLTAPTSSKTQWPSRSSRLSARTICPDPAARCRSGRGLRSLPVTTPLTAFAAPPAGNLEAVWKARDPGGSS